VNKTLTPDFDYFDVAPGLRKTEPRSPLPVVIPSFGQILWANSGLFLFFRVQIPLFPTPQSAHLGRFYPSRRGPILPLIQRQHSPPESVAQTAWSLLTRFVHPVVGPSYSHFKLLSSDLSTVSILCLSKTPDYCFFRDERFGHLVPLLKNVTHLPGARESPLFGQRFMLYSS